MRPRIVLIGVLAAMALLVIAACGSDDSSSGSSEPLTEAEFVAAADAVCAEADAKLDELGEPEAPDEFGSFLRDSADIAEEQLDGLKALSAPEEIQGTLDRAYELLADLNGKAREAADAFDDGDLASANDLIEEITPLGTELDELAAEIGLDVCSSG